MNIVVPTILTASRSDLEAKLRRVEGLVDTVQIDVVDGRFAAPPTWPYAHKADQTALSKDTGWLRDFGNFKYEMDLMVEAPQQTAGSWIRAGATRLVIHTESARALPALLAELATTYGHEKGFAPDLLSIGLAVNINTDASILEPYLDQVEYVQFMGIAHIGKQGQPFDERVLKKLRAFRNAHPDVLIQVDGGVTLETAPALLAAGADRLIVGHDLWQEVDIAAKLAAYSRLHEEHGQYRHARYT